MIKQTGINRLAGAVCILLCAALRVHADDGTNLQKQELSVPEQRKFDYFYYEGIRLKNAEKQDVSYEIFKHCLEMDSTSSAAMYEISSYYIRQNRPEKAVSLLKNAVLYSPGNQEYRSMLATLLFNMDMFGEAAEEYEWLVGACPEKPELNYFLAEAYARMGETGKAIDTYNALENSLGMHEALSMEKFQLYMTIEQPDSAFSELKKLAAKFPMEPRYPVMIGDMYLQRDDTLQALNYYNQAHDLDPESPYYPVSMANYYEKTGQREAAKQQIREALINERLDMNTKAGILGRYIAQLRLSRQDIDGANTLFQTLLEQHPNESILKLAYGEFLATQGKFEEARFQYQLVTESEPENLSAWQQLLGLSFQTRDMDEVIRICYKWQEIFPEAMEFRFYYYLGIAYYQKKEYQQAIETLQTGIPFIPEDNPAFTSDFYCQIGDACFRIGKTDKAFEAYEESLKYNDKNIIVLNNYAYHLALLKRDLTKAERMSAQCIKMEPDNATYIDTYAWIFFVQGNYLLAKMYIEQAISKDKTNSAELADHCGDILYMSGEKEKAQEQWTKAKELGKNSPTLDRKIAEKMYFEETEDELFNNMDGETIESE